MSITPAIKLSPKLILNNSFKSFKTTVSQSKYNIFSISSGIISSKNNLENVEMPKRLKKSLSLCVLTL
jgi:hypothetical protein